jgi:inactivated superfamily I helicase
MLRQKAERRVAEVHQDLAKVRPILDEVVKMGLVRAQSFIEKVAQEAKIFNLEYKAQLALEKAQKSKVRGVSL